MKSYRTLALKELLVQRVTSILIIIAVTLSTMMVTVIGQSIGILNTMRQEQAASLNGNRYATLHQLKQEAAAGVMSDYRLSYAEKLIALGRSDIPDSKLSILLREYTGNALSAYPQISKLQEGHLPEAPGELALPSDVLSLLGYEGRLGEHISLDLSISVLHDTEAAYQYTGDFVLTGILKPNYIGYVSGSTDGIVGPRTAEKLLPEKYLLYSVDVRTKEKGSFQHTIDDLAATYNIPDYCLQYNDVLLSAMGINYRSDTVSTEASGFSYMAVAGIMTGVLVLLAAGLVIYNILKIAVAKHIRQYGTLRAMGAERGQLYVLVAVQLALLSAVGIPCGMVLGLLSAKGITTAAAGFFNPELFMAQTQEEVAALIAQSSQGKALPLLAGAAVTLLFAFAAALPAARYASKVSPTVAMTQQTVKIRRGHRKPGRIRSFEAFYARMNMKRSRGRTTITILSLVISITVFVALNSFTSILDTSAKVQQMHLGDYSLTNQGIGFSPEDVATLADSPDIEEIVKLKYKQYMPDENGIPEGVDLSLSLQPGEVFHLAGADETLLKNNVPDLTEKDWNAMKEGKACFVKNPIKIGGTQTEQTSLREGDTITVNGVSMTILRLIGNPVILENEGFINGVEVVVWDDVFDKITGESHYTELYPKLSSNADRETAEDAISTLCSRTGGSWLSYENTDAQLKESFEQIRLLAWGFIVFVGLIGILNIINTVYTNIHTRIKEIGVQRAIGMSRDSLYKTFLFEGAYYGLIAAVIGGAAGYICSIFIGAAATDSLRLTAEPVIPILQAALLALMACLGATCIPLRKISRLSIVESIETVE